MGKLYRLSAGIVVGLLLASEAWAVTAVVEVVEDPMYVSRKAASYGNTSLTKFYAPLPVFFEGWKSTPRESIVSYTWNFGDGSPQFSGFNAAHIYETPGKYTAQLTVIDASGATSTASIEVEVLERTGKTYYVDAVTGDDANNGMSMQTAWKTATKAFSGMNTSQYGPGDRILFKRGQTFDFEAGVCVPGHGKAKYGYYFGAYGNGPMPVIKHVGTSTQPMVKIQGVDMGFWGVMDLEFDMTSEEGAVSDFFNATVRAFNLYFLRCYFHDFNQAVTVNGDHDGRRISNVIIKGCTMTRSNSLFTYAKASRYAMIDNSLDFSNNHISYLSWINQGIVAGNSFSRTAFGRLCLRICGNGPADQPTNNVHVLNNSFEGWIDPVSDNDAHNGGGVRYNMCLVEFGPNTTTEQFMEYGIFENNSCKNSETFIEFGNWEHVMVRNNVFSTESTYGGPPRIKFGHVYEKRPLYDIQVTNNLIVSNEKRSGASATFQVNLYKAPPTPARSLHEGIVIKHNRIVWVGGQGRLLTIVSTDPAQIAGVDSNGNALNGSDGLKLFQIGGTWNAPGTLYSLADWQSYTGRDRATVLWATTGTPLPGIASSPQLCTLRPIAVSYTNALATENKSLRHVRLWVKKDGGDWTDTGLTGSGASGTFYYDQTSGDGTYHFATQAEDSAGLKSPAPSGIGHTSTLLQETYVPDATPPTPATVSGPAMTTTSPIALTYSGASDTGGSGLKTVRLYVRKDNGSWSDSGLSNTAPSGTFSYAAGAGDGVYYFATRAEDNAGNLSPAPSGGGSALVVLDTTPPTLPIASAPSVTNTSPIAIPFGGAFDALSGVAKVSLWVKKDSAAWEDTGQSTTVGNGAFSYAPSQGTGRYYFAFVCRDVAGNQSAAPADSGHLAVMYDVSPPTLGTLSAPSSASAQPLTVTYSGVEDDGSGLRGVYLWYKKGTGNWTNSGLASTAGSGTFTFNGVTGNGVYHFALQADDVIGNITPAPSGDGSAISTFNSTLLAGSVSAPSMAKTAPVTISHSGASDSNGQLKLVRLWFKQGATGTWTDSGLKNTTASGVFSFNNFSGDGTYFFGVEAENASGETTGVPSGASVTQTIFDTTPPSTGSLSVPASTNTIPVAITYTGVTDAGAGVKVVVLWCKKGEGGAWAPTELSSTQSSGTFQFGNITGNDKYFFALSVEDKAGNVTTTPTGTGAASTLFQSALTAGTALSPQFATSGPITVEFAGASDNNNWFKLVRLWFKKGSAGVWTDSGLTNTSTSGAFEFNGMTGDDTYFFGLQAESTSGETTPAPQGDGDTRTLFDATAPIAGSVAAPATADSKPISVTYTGASDSGSGLKAVTLWYKKGATGTWTSTGQSSPEPDGTFDFAQVTGNATYFFATRAEDMLGNLSPLPSGDGTAATVFNSTLIAGVAEGPAYTRSGPVTIRYSGAYDSEGTLASVHLWAKKGAKGLWADTGLNATTSSGEFTFNQFNGDDTYYFALQARNTAGAMTPAPSGNGDCQTKLDTTPPTTGTLTAPATAGTKPFIVSYAGVSDAGAGVKSVTLWFKKGVNGTWASAGQSSSMTSGSFQFSNVTGNDTYYFALQAEDHVGNLTDAPSGGGSASTTYKSVLLAGVATAPQWTKTKPITVSYSGATDGNNWFKLVRLWFKKGVAGAWTDSGLTSTSTSGSFAFNNVTGDDTYYFALQAENKWGDTTNPPEGDGDTRTIYDTTAPAVPILVAPASAESKPIQVKYSDALDEGCGVKAVTLWFKKGGTGTWTNTGLTSAETSGTFDFVQVTGNATYYFATRVEDMLGNLSPMPTASGAANTVFSARLLPGVAVAPKYANSGPITVTYSGAYDSDGTLTMVYLWVKKGAKGTWTNTGLTFTESSGEFVYDGFSTDDIYYFGLQAQNAAGTKSAAPTGNGDTSTHYDTTMPVPGKISVPRAIRQLPLIINYTGAGDSGTGMDAVKLWMKEGRGGAWVDTGLKSSVIPSGSFQINQLPGDAQYFFYLQAKDKAGNASPEPTDETVFAK